MPDFDPIFTFKAALAADLGIDVTAISDSVARAAIDDPLLLHHVNTCRTDSFLQSLLLQELQARAKAYPQQSSLTLLQNAATAALTWLSSGAKLADKDTYQSRIDSCKLCEHRKPAPMTKLYKLLRTEFICELCGCDLSKKARMLTETCPDRSHSPLGRWPC